MWCKENDQGQLEGLAWLNGNTVADLGCLAPGWTANFTSALFLETYEWINLVQTCGDSG